MYRVSRVASAVTAFLFVTTTSALAQTVHIVDGRLDA